MALQTVSLFFRNNRTYSVGNITLDIISNESHNFPNSITQFNVEDGSVISDHIENQLFNGSLTGVVSTFSLFQNGIVTNRAQDAFDALEQLWRNKELVTINTVLKVYENVGISGLSANKSTDEGEQITIDISFIEVNVVKLQELQVVASIKVPDMSTSQNQQSSPLLDVGKTRPVVGG